MKRSEFAGEDHSGHTHYFQNKSGSLLVSRRVVHLTKCFRFWVRDWYPWWPDLTRPIHDAFWRWLLIYKKNCQQYQLQILKKTCLPGPDRGLPVSLNIKSGLLREQVCRRSNEQALHICWHLVELNNYFRLCLTCQLLHSLSIVIFLIHLFTLLSSPIYWTLISI